jgi:hypothetical protein
MVLGGRNNWLSFYRGSSLPGNPKKCATVASGSYDFKAEMNSRYPGSPVLRIGDPGGNVPVVGGKNPNPDSTAPAGYANGVLMHKAFENRDGTTGSCGCMGVEANDWSRFSGQFNVDDTGTVKIFR